MCYDNTGCCIDTGAASGLLRLSILYEALKLRHSLSDESFELTFWALQVRRRIQHQPARSNSFI